MLLLASCVKVDPVPGPDDGDDRMEISFSTTTEATKGDMNQAGLEAGGWGLYGYYTGTNDYSMPSQVQGVLFNHRQVRWDEDNSVWDYSYTDPSKPDKKYTKEYWPMSADEKVTFFAYAPYSEYSSAASLSNTDGPLITYIASTDLSAQKDLLWGTNTSGLPHRNVNRTSYSGGSVDMHFRHAPAKIHFTINGAEVGDETSAAIGQGNASSSTTYSSNNDVIRSQDATGSSYYGNTLYWAYRKKTVVTTEVHQQTFSEFKILINSVEMENFIKEGILHLNNNDAFIPYWTHNASTDSDYLTYSFVPSDMTTAVVNPENESLLSAGWGTTYLGVNGTPKELLRIPSTAQDPDNYIYMVPKAVDTSGEGSRNITISVLYHVIGLSTTVRFTRTTTTVSYQRVPYYGTNNYQRNNGTYNNLNNNTAWQDFTSAKYPQTSTYTDGASTVVNTSFNYSQDNPPTEDVSVPGKGFRAVGSINSDILGGRDYTINLFLDGRELNLTVIPQQWDLHETMYDYNSQLNPIIQSLTYDSDFVYDVIGSNVYINNRMGKFYFKLGSGMYLYWQASLIGDDAFAFTDENGNYLLDDNGDYRTTIRGDIGDAMNYIYVKASNTSSPVTSRAKLRIYLFNSENHAVVALPKDDWLFISSTYTEGTETKYVQEWTVVQTAN